MVSGWLVRHYAAMIARLKHSLRRLAYATGALGAMHRLVNRDRLTVVMFHRVLSPRDPRWAGADPEYTMSDALFSHTLAFLRRHYSIVSLAALLDAMDGAGLPPCPLLITIDDGWADTAEFALPALQGLSLPATVFVAAGAVDRQEAFWEERLYAAWRQRRATVPEMRERAGLYSGEDARASPHGNSESALRALVTALGRASEAERSSLLATLPEAANEPQHMLSTEQLHLLARHGIAIGVHGLSHAALTEVDAAAELTRARFILQERLRGIYRSPMRALSFPHGRYDATAIDAALACGYSLLFTSDPVLTPLSRHRRLASCLLGRVDIPASAVTGEHERPDEARMATWLFLRRAGRLALDPGSGFPTPRSNSGHPI